MAGPPLTMRAWTQRRSGAVDAYGHPTGWADQLPNEPCYWWVVSGDERVDEQRSVALAVERVMLSRDADIATGDRIRRLVDHAGRTIWDHVDGEGLAREVEHVAVERTHVEARLRSTR